MLLVSSLTITLLFYESFYSTLVILSYDLADLSTILSSDLADLSRILSFVLADLSRILSSDCAYFTISTLVASYLSVLSNFKSYLTSVSSNFIFLILENDSYNDKSLEGRYLLKISSGYL